jgi:3'-5' exoribonuclease
MKQFIKDFQRGQTIRTAVLLKKKEVGKTKDNKPYLKLEFADNSGMIEGRLWNDAESAQRGVEIGDVVMIDGGVDAWKDILQVRVDLIRRAAADEYQLADMLRSAENIPALFEKTKSILRKNIQNRWVALLVKEFLDDAPLMERFQRAPGARSWHNAYVGGLLEHTYEVMVIVEKMMELYPQAMRDIAIVGAFLHDIGKIVELDPYSFEYTAVGGLIGHLPAGFEIMSEKIKAISGFPDEIALQLKHIILAHHGEYEQQSPVLPKTLEAIIVYHADELVSQANAVKEIMLMQGVEGRDWSQFVTIKNRKFYLKRVTEDKV